MSNFFVPYSGDSPAAVLIKGHRFIILCRERLALEDSLETLGADSLREFSTWDSQEEDAVLDSLAREVDGGVVVAPDDMELDFVIENLEQELPWLH